ncbi:MAG TPA: sensor histidine kinase [Paenibacillaceae bacterium]
MEPLESKETDNRRHHLWRHNLLWRHMGESVIYSLIAGGLFVYLLFSYGLASRAAHWTDYLVFGLSACGVAVIGGAAFGFLRGYRIRGRLDDLTEAMRQLETGNLGPPLPDMGDDEIGRLARQLERIRRKWEDQVTSLQRLTASLADMETRARMNAALEERQRLARELHDSVSQQLFAISMTATAVRRTLDQDFERARRQVELIEEMAAAAQSEMRALLLHLRPVQLADKPLALAVRELVAEMRAKVPMEIALDIDEDLPINRGVENHLFRLLQEAMSNTFRHARASRMEISLKRRGDAVQLLVQDNGVGFDPRAKRQTSYGLTNMEERVNELGGSLQIASAPGKGTRVDIRIPLVKGEAPSGAEQTEDGAGGAVHAAGADGAIAAGPVITTDGAIAAGPVNTAEGVSAAGGADAVDSVSVTDADDAGAAAGTVDPAAAGGTDNAEGGKAPREGG